MDNELILRVPPQDIEAEQTVLGSMMLDTRAASEMVSTLKAKDFYRAAHATTFEAIESLLWRGDPVDVQTVASELRTREELDAAGGYMYLMELCSSVPTTANVGYYAKVVRFKSELRELADLGRRLIDGSFLPDLKDPMKWALNEVLGATKNVEQSTLVSAAEAGDELMATLEERYEAYQVHKGEVIPGRVKTGFIDLDRLILGVGRDEYVIVGARPGMGKSGFLISLGRQMAKNVGPVLYVSLEMSRNQVMSRILAAESKVFSEDFKLGSFDAYGMGKVRTASKLFSKYPFYILDDGSATVGDIRFAAQQIQAKHGQLGGIIVDYLQLVKSRDIKKSDNREQEIARISGGLRELMRSMGCPVIAAAQLSRGVESRADKRPVMSDLRESGSIEQDANLIIGLYRDHYYNPDSAEKDIVEAIVLKNRDGKTGTEKLYFNPELISFENLRLDQK